MCQNPDSRTLAQKIDKNILFYFAEDNQLIFLGTACKKKFKD